MDILCEGFETLCKNDSDSASLLSPRKEEIISLLNQYIKEIELFNPAYGLVGTDNTNDLIIRHILDSLAPLGIILRLLKNQSALKCIFDNCENPRTKIADAGSGAGLPGIPLAIAMPHCDFSLVERMGRRAGFLLNTKAALSLTNITIEESEIEKIPQDQFDLVTFRAFKPIEPKLLKTLLKVCKPDGVIAAYKGKMEKIREEMEQLTVKWEAIPYNVPFLDEERNILVIRL